MGIIAKEDIVAYRVKEQLVCTDCYKEAEDGEVLEGDVLTDADLKRDEEKYFCDRCGKEI